MKITCKECNTEFERSDSVKIYGTHCPRCKVRIKPTKKPEFVEDYEMKKRILQKLVINKIRNKLRRNTDGY